MISSTTALASLDGLVYNITVHQIAVAVRANGKYTTLKKKWKEKKSHKPHRWHPKTQFWLRIRPCSSKYFQTLSTIPRFCFWNNSDPKYIIFKAWQNYTVILGQGYNPSLCLCYSTEWVWTSFSRSYRSREQSPSQTLNFLYFLFVMGRMQWCNFTEKSALGVGVQDEAFIQYKKS